MTIDELIQRLEEYRDAWEYAFDTCREKDRPLTVRVPAEHGEGFEFAHIMPSGHCRTLYRTHPDAIDDDGGPTAEDMGR